MECNVYISLLIVLYKICFYQCCFVRKHHVIIVIIVIILAVTHDVLLLFYFGWGLLIMSECTAQPHVRECVYTSQFV